MMYKRLTVIVTAMLSLVLMGLPVFAAPTIAAPEQALLESANPSTSSEPSLRPVQLFDVAAGKVVKNIPNDDEFQKIVASWTKSITGLAPQITSDANCSHVFRVPLAKPANIKWNEINVNFSDVFLFYCKDKEPFLLVFDEQRKPYLFLFKEDIKPFLTKVGFPVGN